MANDALGALLDRAVPYEQWRAPLDLHFKRLVVWSGISTVTALVGLLMLGPMLNLAQSGFFILGQGVLVRLLWAMLEMQPWLIGANLVTLAVYGGLLAATHWLEAGPLTWQRVAMAEVVIGGLNFFVLSLEAALVVINVAIWIVIVVAAVAAAILALFGMLAAAAE